MPRIRKKRVRSVRVARGRSAVQSDISTWDYVRLKQELCARPDYVLAYFRDCQIESLTELTVFLEILQESRETACRIAFVAATMGIRIGDEPPATPDPVPEASPSGDASEPILPAEPLCAAPEPECL